MLYDIQCCMSHLSIDRSMVTLFRWLHFCLPTLLRLRFYPTFNKRFSLTLAAEENESEMMLRLNYIPSFDSENKRRQFLCSLRDNISFSMTTLKEVQSRLFLARYRMMTHWFSRSKIVEKLRETSFEMDKCCRWN